MTQKLSAGTAIATEIAGVHRQRFNEAVAQGFYPCAPATVRGADREFEVNDIVVLTIYGRLRDEGVIPRSAGKLAEGLWALLKQFPDLESAICLQVVVGSQQWLNPAEFDRSATTSQGLSIVSAREWYLKWTRDRIIERLQDHLNENEASDASGEAA